MDDSNIILLDNNNNCLICLDLIDQNECFFKCINCKQNIHLNCLVNWIKFKKYANCPVCKEFINNLNNNNLFNLNRNNELLILGLFNDINNPIINERTNNIQFEYDLSSINHTNNNLYQRRSYNILIENPRLLSNIIAFFSIMCCILIIFFLFASIPTPNTNGLLVRG